MMKGVAVLDFKDGRNANKRLIEGPNINKSIWSKFILPIDQQFTFVSDLDRNLFLTERNLLPTCDNEKYRLSIQGCIRVGEVISKITPGYLNNYNNVRNPNCNNNLNMKSYSGIKKENIQQIKFNLAKKFDFFQLC